MGTTLVLSVKFPTPLVFSVGDITKLPQPVAARLIVAAARIGARLASMHSLKRFRNDLRQQPDLAGLERANPRGVRTPQLCRMVTIHAQRGDEMHEDHSKPLVFKVIVSHERQFCPWLVDRENPPGWFDAGQMRGTAMECLAHIKGLFAQRQSDAAPKSTSVNRDNQSARVLWA
jgi:MbtH protein